MELNDAINSRRAYRSLEYVEITEDTVKKLASSASLAPSCYNKQPWRLVFVYEPDALEKIKTALSSGNAWAKKASMIIAVFSKKDYDCMLEGRDYFLFDTGMAVGLLVLEATQLGLVAHPIAGYNEQRAKEILGLPDDVQVITLVVVGKKRGDDSELNEKQRELERNRPERIAMSEFAFYNKYK